MRVTIKTEFEENKEMKTKATGIVTDGVEKVNVIIDNFDKSIKFEKGERIKLIGKFIQTAYQLTFVIADMSNIIQLKEHKMNLKDLKKITKVAKRNSNEVENHHKV